jgi:hypothetical protein
MKLSLHNETTRRRASLAVFFIVLAVVVPQLMDTEYPPIVDVLLAPTWAMTGLIGRFIPMGNISTDENPVYEATPNHLVVGLTLVFLNLLLYPTVTYLLLTLLSRFSRRASSRL